MAKKQVVVNSNVKERLSISELEGLQGDLKEITPSALKKLESSILKHGFFVPMFIWENPEDATIRILDGHTRLAALKSLKEKKYSIPQIPVVFIEAENIEDAKSKLLAISSQYGKITQRGMDNFLSGLEFDFDLSGTVEIGGFDFNFDIAPTEDKTTTVKEHERELKNTSQEIDLDNFNDFEHQCPKCGFEWNNK